MDKIQTTTLALTSKEKDQLATLITSPIELTRLYLFIEAMLTQSYNLGVSDGFEAVNRKEY